MALPLRMIMVLVIIKRGKKGAVASVFLVVVSVVFVWVVGIWKCLVLVLVVIISTENCFAYRN